MHLPLVLLLVLLPCVFELLAHPLLLPMSLLLMVCVTRHAGAVIRGLCGAGALRLAGVLAVRVEGSLRGAGALRLAGVLAVHVKGGLLSEGIPPPTGEKAA
jgi:hypothetical protein